MKISQELRSQLESAKKNPLQQSVGTKNFDSVVASESKKLKEQELNKLMQQLTSQGEKLAKFRSFSDLAKYKRMVKGFVKEAVQFGMDLKQSHSWSPDGHSRKLTIVEEVDEKLVSLTEMVLEQEKKSIRILDVIGEIKGLLVNLYT
ncbi:YaaR family protein [Aquibacillus kalidii]|uniref:YaaR family protein n=1 Tax=Aquibacillus kalidii TaxID=2762597 RepID=UPI00164617A3|nr:YaaR family protein [Aquibacillus kalidii]